MKKIGKLAAVLVVIAAAIGMMGCAQPSGGSNAGGGSGTPAGETIPAGFVKINAGTFQMGSNTGYDDNKPVHKVTISKAFYMCDHEVTQAEYQAVMGTNPSNFNGTTGKEAAEGETQDNRPVENVSWYMAIVYCNKKSRNEKLKPCYKMLKKTADPASTNPDDFSTDPEDWGDIPTSSDTRWNKVTCEFTNNGYRLPTEAEWEYAARAGDTAVDALTWSGTSESSSLGNYAWYSGNSGSKTHEVKKTTGGANAWGLYDMSGNVWEWCWDWWPASNAYTAGDVTDPTGDTSGSRRVDRGGSWGGGSGDCAVSCRGRNDPYGRGDGLGFRVVRSSSN